MTEQTTPANARGVCSMQGENLLRRAEEAQETASTVYALIEICRAAAEFADDQEFGDYVLAKHVPINLSTVLKLANKLTIDMAEVFELVIAEERKKTC